MNKIRIVIQSIIVNGLLLIIIALYLLSLMHNHVRWSMIFVHKNMCLCIIGIHTIDKMIIYVYVMCELKNL